MGLPKGLKGLLSRLPNTAAGPPSGLLKGQRFLPPALGGLALQVVLLSTTALFLGTRDCNIPVVPTLRLFQNEEGVQQTTEITALQQPMDQ
jgi:hypothetical protein